MTTTTQPDDMTATISLREWLALKSSHATLLAALRDVVTFLEPDSVIDQRTDTRLRMEADAALDRARAAIAKAEKP